MGRHGCLGGILPLSSRMQRVAYLLSLFFRFSSVGLLGFWAAALSAADAPAPAAAKVRELKITILSTMLADGKALGEWGFAALVEVDGRKLLFDTGAHTDVVLKNAETLGLDLATVPEIVLSHHHWDHVGGLLTLRNAARAKAPAALARVHVGEGAFLSRLSVSPGIEDNPLLIVRQDFEATGGTFVVHRGPTQLYPGVWLTGPVPRQHPERNWSGSDKMRNAAGAIVADDLPEDQALVFDTERGLVVLFGCGHAGVINTLEHARSIARPARVHAVIGGVHIFSASDETLRWTEGKLKEFGVENFIGAHCTGLDPVYRYRTTLNLDRAHAVVGAVGATFDLVKGIEPGAIAK